MVNQQVRFNQKAPMKLNQDLIADQETKITEHLVLIK